VSLGGFGIDNDVRVDETNMGRCILVPVTPDPGTSGSVVVKAVRE